MAEQAAEKTKAGKAERRATQRLVVDAARRVLVRDGASAVSTANVAAEAGVAPNVVKDRFRNTDELLLAVAVGELLTVSRAARGGGSESQDWIAKSGDALGRVLTIARTLGPSNAAADLNETKTSAPSDQGGESVGDLGRRIRALGQRQSSAAADLVAALEAASNHLSVLDGTPAAASPETKTAAVSLTKAGPKATNAFLANARQAANDAAAARVQAPRKVGNPIARLLPGSSAVPGNPKRRGRTLLLAGLAPTAVLVAGFFVYSANMSGVNLTRPAVVTSTAHTPLVLASLPQTESSGPLDRLAASAKSGDAKAELLLGLKYLQGDGRPQDQSQAFHWLQRAAEGGQPVAQYHLGNLYAPDGSVLFNPMEAARWYEAAAGQGNLQAMNNIAVSYAEGTGVAKNPAEAAQWLLKAATLGFTTAQFNLAVMYERGDGVERSLVDAYKWYAIAAASGDEEAQARRDLVRRDLTPPERITAERAAQTFHAEAPEPQANDAPPLADIVGG